MIIDHKELLASFESLLKHRNVSGLRLGALLITILFPLFWVLDWVVLPEWVMTTLWLRLFGTFYSLSIWVATFHHRDLIYRHVDRVAILLGVMIAWLVAVIAWLDDGYASPYYAGVSLVILGASFLFAWPLHLALGFNTLVYGFYMAPLLIGSIGIHDLGTMISNQFFLLGTILVTVIAQQHRLNQERKDYLGIEQHRILLQQAEILAATDPLTGLYNRRQLFTLGVYELSHARRLHQPLSVLAIDIDYFKQINDAHGHPIGDEVLRAVARIFQSSLRQEDILARVGGDEFVVLLPRTDIHEAASIAERIRLAMQGQSIHATQLQLLVTMSIGVAQLTADIVDLDALLLRSDEALYAAKHAGRACVRIYSSLNTKQASQVP